MRRRAEKLEKQRQIQEEEAELDAAPSQRRKIPTAPHRQLFLVDGVYGDAYRNWLPEGQRRDDPDPMGGGSGVPRLDADPAAVPMRIGRDTVKQFSGQPGIIRNGGTHMTRSNKLSFYISPSVPHWFQFGANHHHSGGDGVDGGNGRNRIPSTPSTPHDSDSSIGKSHNMRKLKRLCIKQRFYEPVELQVESLPALVLRLVLFVWYTALLAAMVMEVIPRVQWSVLNICGSGYPTDLRHVEKWSSPCVASTPMESTTVTSPDMVLTWAGQDLHHLHSTLVRFRRIVVSLPTPADQANSVEHYDLIASTTMEGGDLTWTSNRSLTLRCQKIKSRCDTARVPEDLLAETSGSNSFHFSLRSVPPSLAAGAADGAVGVAYQRSSYTIATVVWRYVLLFLSLIHTLRFIALRKYTSTLYEQEWTLALQIALFWYLNPLFAVNVTSWPMPAVLAFMEYRIPTYFMAVVVAYMMSVMTASMSWTKPANDTNARSVLVRVKAFLLRSHSVYDPPMWTKIIVCLYLAFVFVLVIIDVCVEQIDWNTASNSFRVERLYWSVIALLLFGGLICLIMLLYLRNYLGNKPYLESRPQQLACRVFLMIFLSSVVYYIFHCLVFFLLYNDNYTALASQQPFLQLPALMVASFFVNIMTLVYTSQSRDDNVPINPKDFRWKHMVWPDTWYRWLARRGGSQYIFYTEAEETRFYRLQFEFRTRQFMAKQKRKQQQQGGGDGGGGSMAANERSNAFGALGEAMQSGLSSFFRSHNAASGTAARSCSRGAAMKRGSGEAPWRTDVWETPMPSQPMSPATSNDGGSDNGGAPLPHRLSSSLAGTHRVEDAAGEESRYMGTDTRNRFGHFESAGANNFSGLSCFPNNRSGSFARGRDGTAADNATSVSLAAQSVLNMDRFSTYFLPDGDGGAPNVVSVAPPAELGNNGGGGGYARRQNSRQSSPTQSPQRELSNAFDAFEVEGPAHHRSRLLQSASIARHRESSLRHREPTTTSAENIIALSGSFAGMEDRQHLSSQAACASAPRMLGSGIRSGSRLTCFRSDDDLPHSSSEQAACGAERPLPLAPQTPQQPQLPLPPSSRYRDPVYGLTRAASASSDRFQKEEGGDDRQARRPPQSPSPHLGTVHKDEMRYLNSSIDIDTTCESAVLSLNVQQPATTLPAVRQVQQESLVSQPDTLVRGPHALPVFTATPTTPQPSKQDSDGGDTNEGGAGRHRASPPIGSTSAGPRTPGQAVQSSLAPSNLVADIASDLSVPTSEDDDSDDDVHGRWRRSFFQTLNVMRERLGAVMGAAERNLFERPARNLDRLEMQVFDAAYRPFQSMHYLPFFNLETAIDCYNISWEAYGVEKSVGDELIETGIKFTPQNVPKTVAHGVKKVVCGCCPAEDDSSQDEEDLSEEESVVSSGSDGMVRYPRADGIHNIIRNNNISSEGEQRQDSTSAAVPPASSGNSGETTAAPAEQHGMLASRGQVRSSKGSDNNDDTPPALHCSTVHNSTDAVVIVHMAGEGSQNRLPKAELPPGDEASRRQLAGRDGKEDAAADRKARQAATTTTAGARTSSRFAQGGSAAAASPSSPTSAAPMDSNLYPIDVEKYGFKLLLVAEMKEVQVIMVKMDTSAPEHRGKAPRIIIGFRGTANMSNAKYDMNIHRVVWREMEQVEEEGNQSGLDGLPTDMASTLDGASTVDTQHLGCAACLRSWARATSWRPTCHAGFLSIWKTLKPTVMQRLREILQEDRNIVYRIFTTGHSLGGALASLSAYSITAVLRRERYPIPEVTVYTYGQPRMGNRTFQRIYNKAVPRSFSVVNESDMVVSMIMFGGYHVGIEVDIDRNGNFIVKPTEIEKLFPPTAGRGMTVINHLMANYGISLNAIASRTTCPARGLACYSTADPKKIAETKAREEAQGQFVMNVNGQ
ncbi:putative lipase domain protein [Leptomonas seymouri]|uniref:Putative lipase domain protein n=1 Tax=Leptomonas seymouri TaxID=5684 RepID=A0A0N1HZL9_LEPSE|nr:putative lipase domain protein [Leptomonas seymouri]|eukprot:KPI87532.1 putative lipase domain protein [Leptomonas seymouri]